MLVQDIINKLQHFASYLPLIGLILIALVATALVIKGALRIVGLHQLLKRKVIYFELTPLAFTDKSPRATEQLFSVLHGLGSSHSWRSRLFRRKTVFSLELVSSREQGIRYILGVSEREAASYHKAVTGYLPEISIKQIKDYLPTAGDKSVTKVVSFKQTGNFAFPLMGQQALDKYDPIAHITSAMTKLETSEFMALQYVLSPAYIPEADAIAHKQIGRASCRERV